MHKFPYQTANFNNTKPQLLSVKFSHSVKSDSETPWTAAWQASMSITNSQSLLKLISIESWCHPTSHPLLSPSRPAFNLSQHQGLFHWVSSLHQVAKVLEFQLQISPSNEYSRLTSLRRDWFYLLAVQGTLKSLLQHHSSKASILQRSAFFTV